MSAAGRPLLAARGSPGDVPKDGSGSPAAGPTKHPAGSNRTKRTLIESACQACRRRKSKCDGQRPSCSRCLSLRSDCIYEAEEGESRWSALKRRNQQLESEREEILELLNWVRSSPEPEAMVIFERIRTTAYENLFGLLNSIRNDAFAAGVHPTHLHFPSNEQRLPPINSILVSAPAAVKPPPLVQHNSVSSDEGQPGPIPDFTTVHRAHIRAPLETLEPALQPNFVRPTVPSLSSEDSSGSSNFSTGNGAIGSMSLPATFGSEEGMRRGSLPRRPGGL